jgi:hypothetical protein
MPGLPEGAIFNLIIPKGIRHVDRVISLLFSIPSSNRSSVAYYRKRRNRDGFTATLKQNV